MQRLLRLSLLSMLVVLFGVLAFSESYALKPMANISGRVAPGDVRVLLKDTVYLVDGDYVIGGTLLIEPGTEVKFYSNSRLIDSVGGRIIADGLAKISYVANPLVSAADNPFSALEEIIYPDYPQGKNNPFDFQDYADLDYFLYNLVYNDEDDGHLGRTIEFETVRDPTVHKDKYHHIFNVVLDIPNRAIVNLEDPTEVLLDVLDPTDNKYYVVDLVNGDPLANFINRDLVVIPFENAMMFIASRMGKDPENDIDLRRFPWSRVESDDQGGVPAVNIGAGDESVDEIKFDGQPQNNMSREWGHIIIMPGARAAFFRNCSFNEFKKDTTVDNKPLYDEFQTDANWPYINNKIRLLTNGSGGVISTFSSRTWLLDCSFSKNFARHRGGAVQILQTPNLQAPYNFPMDANNATSEMFDIFNPTLIGRYTINKNPNITNKDGSFSSINKMRAQLDGFGNLLIDGDGHYVEASEGDPFEWVSTIPAIDLIDEDAAEPVFNDDNDASKADYYRQAFDDARLAVYLGRMRNLTFEKNLVQLAYVHKKLIPGTPPIYIIDDWTDTDPEDETSFSKAASYPREYDDVAYGGAVYIAGDVNDPSIRQIEVGFGVNNSIRINDGAALIEFTDDDSFVCTENKARNFQDRLQSSGVRGSKGARGGALYVGANTSMIVAGKFISNVADAPWIQQATSVPNHGYYAMGGAIFAEKTRGRLQVRGGPTRDQAPNDNDTEFENNQAGAGGAIFVDNNINDNNNFMSPIIGGSNTTLPTRDYGFNIKFVNNTALSYGGAIFSRRSFTIYGAGGIDPLAESLIGYGGKYPILFDGNDAGFVGGAIDVRLPISSDLVEADRSLEFVRAIFRDNTVGQDVFDDLELKKFIRGGGAVYIINGSMSVVKGVEFRGNKVKNGNGGAVAMINPQTNTKRFFLTDVDEIIYTDGMASAYTSTDAVFTTASIFAGDPTNKYPPDTRMLTRFLDNEIEWDEDILKSESGSGTTQVGAGSRGTSENLNGIGFIDSQNGFVVGDNGTIIQLLDGGSEWVYKKGNTNKNLNKVVFLTQNIGYIIGQNSVILKTTDGGDNWNKIYENIPVTNKVLYDIDFINSEVGFAVGESGIILKTTDAGSSWNTVNASVDNDLYGIDFSDENYGYIVGERGLVLKTTDAGVNWGPKESGTLQDLVAVKFLSAKTGYTIGTNGVILRTHEYGNTWNTLDSKTDVNLNSFHFPDQNTAFVAGDNGIIVKSTNSGERWEPVASNVTPHSLNDVYFHTKMYGYAVGDLGYILKTTNGGVDWEKVEQANMSTVDSVRTHANGETILPENGIGLGGALYILDVASIDRATTREDTISFNRVRLQSNTSYTGAAIYSDNFNLKLIFNRSLVTGNVATSERGADQNAITGPYLIEESISHTFNKASSDLSGAIIYGEIQGPLPANNYSWAANSIYDNVARFLIRLPDAPNSKGVLIGETGVGFSGVDTLRGNYWGRTEANVTMEVENLHQDENSMMETFFVDTDGERRLDFIFWQTVADRNNYESSFGNLLFQGPFESITRYEYKAIPLRNLLEEEISDTTVSIPENLLQSGRIYDLYDKGTDIKIADYSKRRMSPIEDFAVGIPPIMDRYLNSDSLPSNGKYIKRYARDPYIADSVDSDNKYVYPEFNELQGEFMANEDNELYHPIGYPLFLETKVVYENGLPERYNLDQRTLNETVFFVINETTGDFIRVNLKQMATTSPYFRARVEFIPDSADRNPNTSIRRTFEGLLNLGTDAPNGDPKLLKALRHLPINEDRATLVGRKYQNDTATFGGLVNSSLYINNRIEDLFVNAGGMPESNNKNNTNYATFFAGERYRALPVDTGDVIRIVSRTVLWREGVNKALDDGIMFTITNSTEPPIYTGDIYDIQNNVFTKEQLSEFPWGYISGQLDTVEVTEFRNTLFVTEDRMYPAPVFMYSNPAEARTHHGTVRFDEYVKRYGNSELDPSTLQANAFGRDRLINMTAVDFNRYYDPRSLFAADDYANLYFSWEVDSKSGLKRWLRDELITASDPVDEGKWGFANYQDPDSVKGFLIIRGRPTNPFVVPGGEVITLRVHNFPPHYRTIDSLKNLPDDTRPKIDTIEKFIEIFSSYLHAPKYDSTNARYLQQDTIDLGKQYIREYECRIYVVDSIPIFLDPNDDSLPKEVFVETNINSDEEVMGTYTPSVYSCMTNDEDDDRLMANLTDKLRFQADFNTNDELEDAWAENNWDFRYGRTAYGFRNIALRPDDEEVVIDTVVIDTTVYDGEDVFVQQRPIWMDNQFIFIYDSDTEQDEFGSDFTISGMLNIRIDSLRAVNILTPMNQYNDALNLDTVFTVVVNDGHGGVNSIDVPVMINVEPKMIPVLPVIGVLPDAMEDIDYNPQLLDNGKAIQIFDPNFDQDHWFELAYSNPELDELPDDWDRDPCFIEAGKHYLRRYDDNNELILDLKTTPDWIKINKETGLLYGTPGVKDAPRTETITVVVWDEDSLSTIKQYTIVVEPNNHCPNFAAAPKVQCVDQNGAYEDIIILYDRDLRRGRVAGDVTDTLEVTVIQPSGLRIEVEGDDGEFTESNQIIGIREKDTVRVKIITDDFTGMPGVDGRVTVKIMIRDLFGCTDTLEYRLQYSDPVDFICNLTIENNKGGIDELQFGTAGDATQGYGESAEDSLGRLDQQYCEYEIPPIPPQDIFDVRWSIPNSNGIYRNIFKTIRAEARGPIRVYRGRLQSGGEAGSTSNHYPMTITWSKDCVPASDDEERNPAAYNWWIQDAYSNGAIFQIDMNDISKGRYTPDVEVVEDDSEYKLIIYSDQIDAFQIVYTPETLSSVDQATAGYSTEITNAIPNPFTSSTKIQFYTLYREQVKVEMVDKLGKVVKVLIDGSLPPGVHEIEWDGRDNNGNQLASGSYTCRMVAGSIISTEQIVIIK